MVTMQEGIPANSSQIRFLKKKKTKTTPVTEITKSSD